MKRCLWLGVCTLLVLTATSCGGGKVLEADGRYVLVGEKRVNEAGTGFGGTVPLVGDCVGLDRGGDDVVVIWPHGTKILSTDPVVLDVPHLGRVELGDSVDGGGDDCDAEAPIPGVEVPRACS